MSGAGSEDAPGVALDPEDRARANLYGVIGRLFYAPADPNFLAEISRGEQGGEGQDHGSGLVAAWRDVQEACRNAYPAVVRQEFDSLFIGVGKAQVSPYLSGYAEPMSPDRFLVRLRDQLTAFGLGRREKVFEVEDHVSGISDVMRWLIENGHGLNEQKQFFETFAYPGVQPLCVAVQNAPSASFYKGVAALAWSFFEIEKTAFEMAGSE
jgi:TorA maturation chaperone TorD